MSIETPIQGHRVRVGPELSTTPVTDANNFDMATTVRYYTTFTLPAAAALYTITGIEWKNGTNVAGNIYAAVEYVGQTPPTSANMMLAAWCPGLAQAGADAVQRNSRITSALIPGGTILAVYVGSTSASSDMRTVTVGSKNISKAVAVTVSLANETAWTAGTEEPYVKVYYKAVL